MSSLQVILPIAVGAVIGYCTNEIAIKMLFWPRKEWHIGKWKVPFTPGVIPKNKDRIASAVGNAVSDTLLTEQDLVERIGKTDLKERMADKIVHFVLAEDVSLEGLLKTADTDTDMMLEQVSSLLSGKIVDGIKGLEWKNVIAEIAQESFPGILSNPMLSMFFGGNIMDSLCEKIGNSAVQYMDEKGYALVKPMVEPELQVLLSAPLKDTLSSVGITENAVQEVTGKILDQLIQNSLPKLVASLNIREIVEKKIRAMDVKELEDLVLSVMKNELQAVVNLGAVIGALIGILNVFI